MFFLWVLHFPGLRGFSLSNTRILLMLNYDHMHPLILFKFILELRVVFLLVMMHAHPKNLHNYVTSCLGQVISDCCSSIDFLLGVSSNCPFIDTRHLH